MKRLLDIENRLIELGEKINASYPKYKKDDDIKKEYANIKNDIKTLQSILRKKINANEATHDEIYVIEPALNESYVTDLKAKVGCNVSQLMADSVYSAQSTISYFLCSHRDKLK